MESNNMVKFAKILDKAAQIAIKVFLIVSIVCVVFAVLVMILGEAMVEKGSFVLELDFVKIHLAEEYQDFTPLMQGHTVLGLLTVAVLTFCVQYGFRILCRILSPMKDGKPFADETPINIGKMAWLIFIGGTIMQVLGVAGQVLLLIALPMDQVFASPAISSLDFHFKIDLGFVFTFLLLRLTAYVFAYGQKLQKESDETL